MPYKDPAKRKLAAAKAYRRNPGRWRAYGAAKYRAAPSVFQQRQANEKQRLVDMLNKGCAFCGESDVTVLVVDHIIPVTQRGNTMGRQRWRPLSALRAGKESPFNLQVLCANDHMRKTAMERRELARLNPRSYITRSVEPKEYEPEQG